MFPPGGCFEPHHSTAVTAGSDEIDSAVPVRVARVDVRRAHLILRDDVLFPWLRRIGWSFPPGEGIARRRRLAFRAGCDVRFAIAVDIAETHVMSQTRCILIRERAGFPGSARAGLCRNRKPEDRLGK